MWSQLQKPLAALLPEVGDTHTLTLSLSLSPTNGTVVDSNCRKFLRFSEGPDLRGNDTFCVGALLLPTAALVITNSGA